MSEKDTCERHPEEVVVANCINCNRGICRDCLRENGYFCSEDCKEQTKEEQIEKLPGVRERREFVQFERKVNRYMKVFARIILPGVVIFFALLIVFKVTSKAGKVLWEFRPPEDEPFSSLTSYKGNMYVGCDNGMLYCLEKQEGKEKWKFKADKSLATAKPVIMRDKLCITWDGESIYAVDIEKGVQVWKRAIAGEIGAGPITGKNAIYYISNFYRELTPEELKSEKRDVFRSGAPFTSYSGTLLRKVSTASSIYALDSTDGHDIWEKQLGKDVHPGYFTSRGGILYLSVSGMKKDKRGYTLLAIDAESGDGKWKAQPTTGSLLKIYPEDEGILLVSNQNFFFISQEGKPIWQQDRGKSTLWRLVVDEGKLYFSEGENKLACVELTTGERIWTTEIASVASSPVIGEGLVFFQGDIEKPLEKGEKGKDKKSQPRIPGFGEDEFLKQFGVREEPTVKMIPVVYALESRTGKMVWRRENIGGRLIYDKGKLFVVRSYSKFKLLDQQFATSNRITAINARRGKTLWKYLHKGLVKDATVDEDTFCFTSFSTEMHIGSLFSKQAPKTKDNTIYAISVKR